MRIRVIFAAITLCLLSISNPASAVADVSKASHSSKLSVVKVKKVIIREDDFTNELRAVHASPPKGYFIRYQWFSDSKPIKGQVNWIYSKTVDDCGKDVKVSVTLYLKSKKISTTWSSAYNPDICTFKFEELKAWPLLYDCGIVWPEGTCTQWQQGGFYAYISGDSHPTTWFKVPIAGIDSSRVLNWRAIVSGSHRDYSLNNLMILRSEPTWMCCDFRGVKPTNGSGTWFSDSWPSISTDGYAYVGFSYFDKFYVSEYLVINTIRVEVEYR